MSTGCLPASGTGRPSPSRASGPEYVVLTNAHLSELLALRAGRADGHFAIALRRASRAALIWPEEAAALAAAGRSLAELESIGPKIGAMIAAWLREPPEVPEPAPSRRGFTTYAAARAALDASPEWRRELRGDLQMHTTWSDGVATVEEMARACAAMGHAYIAVTDHSKGLKIAGGRDEEAFARQGDEIARVNARLGREGVAIRVLRSIEMNLSPQGAGDMHPGALERLELVLGSFHSQLRKEEDQTARYLAALRNPHVDVLGHPRGRKYDDRVGLSADWPAVFAEAARLGKAVEIDAYPDRQDLAPDLVALARDAGATISIGTDAHGPGELAFIDIGVAIALGAGVPRERILNYRSADEIVAWAASNA